MMEIVCLLLQMVPTSNCYPRKLLKTLVQSEEVSLIVLGFFSVDWKEWDMCSHRGNVQSLGWTNDGSLVVAAGYVRLLCSNNRAERSCPCSQSGLRILPQS